MVWLAAEVVLQSGSNAGSFDKGVILEGGLNPLRPNNDVSQTSHRNIKAVSVSEVMRIQVQFY